MHTIRNEGENIAELYTVELSIIHEAETGLNVGFVCRDLEVMISYTDEYRKVLDLTVSYGTVRTRATSSSRVILRTT